MIPVALWIALAGLGAPVVGAAFARWSWRLDLMTHFRLHYMLAGAVLFLLFLSQREFSGAAIGAAIALWQGRVWYGNRPAFDRSADGEEPSVTFLAANLQWSNEERAGAIETLRAASADILVLAEPRRDWLPYIDALADSYPYRSNARWPVASGPQILSRLPILRSRTFHPLVEGESIRPAGLSSAYHSMAARFSFEETVLAVSEGLSLTLLGIHAPSPASPSRSAMRNAYLERLASHCAGIEGPLLLAGDFNLTPFSPIFADFIRRTGLVNVGGGRFATWPTWLGPLGIPIDHALLRGPLSLRHMTQGPRLGSDHWPLVFSIAVGSAPS
jgi:endonuclease/exonuclease/phosphatase (EEP) superfamily protein YafD